MAERDHDNQLSPATVFMISFSPAVRSRVVANGVGDRGVGCGGGVTAHDIPPSAGCASGSRSPGRSRPALARPGPDVGEPTARRCPAAHAHLVQVAAALEAGHVPFHDQQAGASPSRSPVGPPPDRSARCRWWMNSSAVEYQSASDPSRPVTRVRMRGRIRCQVRHAIAVKISPAQNPAASASAALGGQVDEYGRPAANQTSAHHTVELPAVVVPRAISRRGSPPCRGKAFVRRRNVPLIRHRSAQGNTASSNYSNL